MIMRPELQHHSFFHTIQELINYYDSLSFGIMTFVDSPVLELVNLDTYIIESLKSCLESIASIVEIGHINDAYALLRKYYDGFIINIFERIKIYELEDSFEFMSKIIDDWVKGRQKLPSYKIMLKEVMSCSKIGDYINDHWLKEKLLKIRKRCDDHVHSNIFSYMQLNNEVVSISNEEEILTLLERDIDTIFCSHFLMLFSFAPHYMISSDYIDYLEFGMRPPEGSEYEIAPFIQSCFSEKIQNWNFTLASIFKEKCVMKIK